VFEYGDTDQPMNSDSIITVEGGLDESSGVLKWIGLSFLGLIVLGLLGGVFIFFFVEFEEEDFEDDLGEHAVEVDPYAWAKERQQEEAAPAQTEAKVQPADGGHVTQITYNVTQNIHDSVVSDTSVGSTPVSGYPGWKWDAEQNKWVPDEQ
jgi:hypothetical protein